MRRADSFKSHVKAALPHNGGCIVVIKIGTSSLIRQEHNTLHLSNLVGALRAEQAEVAHDQDA